MVALGSMFGQRVTCRPLYVWMPMLLGCVAIASWLLKHKDTEEFYHPRSVSAMEDYLYDPQEERKLEREKQPLEKQEYIPLWRTGTATEKQPKQAQE